MLAGWLIKKPKEANDIADVVVSSPNASTTKNSPGDAKVTPMAKLQDAKKVLTPSSNKDERKVIVSKDAEASDDDADFKVLAVKTAGNKGVKSGGLKPAEHVLKEIKLRMWESRRRTDEDFSNE